jgi:hypothetical protein
MFGNILSCPWISNQACIFVCYTVMGYQFDQDESYNSALDEVLGASTIVDLFLSDLDQNASGYISDNVEPY